MTPIDFTPANPLDVARVELHARALRAQFLRKMILAGAARVAQLLRGTPAPQV